MSVIRLRTPLLVLATACVPAVAPLAAQTGTLVVLNKGDASANIIDLGSGRILATVPTGDGPHEAAITRDGRLAVAADYGGRTPGNSLTVIDVPGLRVVKTIDLGEYRRPHGLAFLPGDSILAVTSETAQQVLLVHVGDGAIRRTIGTEQAGSHMLALVGDATRLYTSNGRDNSVSELDVRTGRGARHFAVPPGPEAITVTPDGREVWVGSNTEGTVNVLDPRTGTVEQAADGFSWPYRILITPDQRHVLIPDLRGNRLRFFDRATREQLAMLEFPGAGPQGITLDADARFAFLALSAQDMVAVIDLARREAVRYITTGSGPDGLAYTTRVAAGR